MRQLQPWARELGDEDWIALSQACAVLARFEQCYRDIGVAIGLQLRLRRRELADPAALLPYVAGEETLADLCSLGRVAVVDHHHFTKADPLHINPTFTQSRALGGADADLIADGLLIDWKASGARSVVGRQEFWQLLGYVLADTDDRYGIDHVGISAVRWRRQLTWSVEELMGMLAAKEPLPSLADLRAEFAEVAALGSAT